MLEYRKFKEGAKEEVDERLRKEKMENPSIIVYSFEEGILANITSHVGFVNNIATMKGGSHVDYITKQIATNLATIVQKKNKHDILKPNNIKSHLWVFVNALNDNPAFDSQTKDKLMTNKDSFGSKYELTTKFLEKVAKSDVMKSLLKHVEDKQKENLKKTDGKRKGKLNIPKLEDANLAASANSGDCTLILTEGDSAKALAMSGLSVVGQDFYGVFRLKGKLLNVREATPKQLQENVEIQNIKKILGLQHGKNYENVNELRYGHLMIMADQTNPSTPGTASVQGYGIGTIGRMNGLTVLLP
ncbi:DNA topoisomerase 2 [Tanacetum coccineum]